MRGLSLCLLPLLLLHPSLAQLRPRRVGVGSMGESAAAADDSSEALSELMEKMSKRGMGGGVADMMNNPEFMEMMKDPEAMMKMMAKGQGMMESNPKMAEKLMKGIEGAMGANPEVAELLTNPAKLQAGGSFRVAIGIAQGAMSEKMAEVADMMNSDEGKELYSKMMQELETVISDPEMMRKGFEEFATNPMFKGLSESPLVDCLVQTALSELGGFEGMQEKLAEMMGTEPGAMASGENLEGLGANGDLQDRVRGQLAAMLQVSESHAHVRHTQQAV
ncbi:MAG: hypothetical protein SGPRY_002773 [Prymnesium sp.]